MRKVQKIDRSASFKENYPIRNYKKTGYYNAKLSTLDMVRQILVCGPLLVIIEKKSIE